MNVDDSELETPDKSYFGDHILIPIVEQKHRYATCKTCDNFMHALKVCKKCGCFMPAKVKLSFSQCPESKW